MRLFRRAAIAATALLAFSNHVGATTLDAGANFQNGPLYITLTGANDGQPFQTSSGSISPSFLDGVPVPYLYCVEITTNINVPGSYFATLSDAGIVHGGLLSNAGQVAWLLDNIAPGATSADAQEGLQAAIWSQVFGANFGLATGPGETSAAIQGFYNADLAALGTNTSPLSDVIWISPYNSDGSNAQGLVTSSSHPVPEPSTAILLGLGIASLVGYSLRKRKA
ncbi:MAG TPA: PEP-CTERM sorting domain-containing protein [Pirellulales bacterium]|jgi:hypothetical protein